MAPTVEETVEGRMAVSDKRRLVAADRIRRAFYDFRDTYSTMLSVYGPRLFFLKDGQEAPHGKLLMSAGASPPRFLCVDSTGWAPLLADFASRHWVGERPEILISVTGGAGSLNIDRKMREQFGRGLVRAAEQACIWLVTGGTDSGVMQLVGDAIHLHGLAGVPVIGVAPLRCCLDHQYLSSCRGGELAYPRRERRSGLGGKISGASGARAAVMWHVGKASSGC